MQSKRRLSLFVSLWIDFSPWNLTEQYRVFTVAMLFPRREKMQPRPQGPPREMFPTKLLTRRTRRRGWENLLFWPSKMAAMTSYENAPLCSSSLFLTRKSENVKLCTAFKACQLSMCSMNNEKGVWYFFYWNTSKFAYFIFLHRSEKLNAKSA